MEIFMRVIAGSKRSMPLKTAAGLETRPTQDRTKETLFNVLQNDVPGSVFLDLFSGSGAIAIEALSRGAKRAYLVENARAAAACIKENLAFTKLTESAVLMETDVMTALRRLEGKEVFDVVFMDPPYHRGYEREALEYLAASSLIGEDTLLVVEASNETEFDYLDDIGFSIIKVKRYKNNSHIFIRKDSFYENRRISGQF